MCRKFACLVSLLLVLGLTRSAPGGLVARWTFDETTGTVARDSSGNGLNGTLMGGPQWVAGKIRGALQFDGVDDYVDCGTSSKLAVTGQITVSCWIKIPAPWLLTWECILAKGDDSYRLSRSGSGNATHMGCSSSFYFDGTVVVTDNQWHMVTGVYDGSAANIYIDGVLDVSMAAAGALGASSYPLYIGENSQARGRYLKGTVDDVRIYDRALGPAQVMDLFNGMEPAWLKAEKPNPPDGATGVTQPLLQWKAGDTAAQHDVYFGTNPDALEFRVRYPRLQTVYYHQAGLTPGTTYYWRIDEVEADGTTIHTGDVWSFIAPSLTAWQPSPADSAEDVFTDVTLKWNAGWNALIHHVYLGESYDDVDNGTADTDKGIVTTPTTYATAGLRAETTYYWRVDEFDSLGVLHKGPVWSFTTLPAGTGNIIREWWSNIGGTAIGDLTGNANYPNNPTGWEFVDLFEGPVDVADNYGSRLRGWLFPPATGNYTFWIATDDQGQLWLSTDADPANKVLIASVSGWVPSRDFDGTTGDPGTNLKSAAISLEAGKAYYIEAMMKEGGGGDNIAVAWQGGPIATREVLTADYVGPTGSLPLKAYNPSPANGATDVVQTVTLGWSAGEKAAQHDVFFGMDRTAVANATTATTGIYRGRKNLGDTTYTPGESPLLWDTTYYWRVDEINTADPEGPWKGNIWSFTTANYLSVENFEAYNDLCGRIFYTWVDGYGHSGDSACGVAPSTGNGTSSTVGYLDAPYAETGVVHGGSQAMPFWYDNTGATGKARYSETVREFATAQDWTRDGVKSLTLWFQGLPASVGSYSYNAATGIHTMTGSGTDIWNVTAPRETSYHDEFHFAYKRLSGSGTITAKVVSVSNTHAWAKAGVMIRETLDGDSVHSMTVVTPGSGVSFQRRTTTGAASANTDVTGITAPQWVKLERTLSGQFIASYSANGTTWTPIGTPESISMQGDVYIGLALTSHNAAATCIAEFSDVTTTGSVTGQWQSQDIGIASNLPDTLYVAVQDASNNSAAVPHTDPNAVLKGTWQPWDVELAKFTGVNLKAIKKVFLGVGNRTAPKTGGSGTLYFDDIELYRPRCKADLARPALSLNNDCVVDIKDLQVLANDWLVGPGSSGLQYEYYEADWDLLPDFDVILPAMAGNVSNFDITVRLRNDYFGFRFSGQIKVATAGSYTFYTTSDDGSQLYIGNTLVVDNDGLHAMVEQSGTISLTAGMHPITVTMFEKGGGEGLVVEYQGPGVTRQEIPDGVLYRLSSVADVRPDGIVDFKDYAVLVDSWLDEVLWP